jgi:hypothetical protein
MHADKLPITGPCPIDLDAIGFDRAAKVAHCSHCAKNVTVLSNMTRGEAREFLREHKGQKLCVSYARDEDGRIRFQPEPALVPVTRLRPRTPAAPVVLPAAELTRPRASRAAGFVAALGVTAALAACAPHGDPPRDTTTATAKPPKPIVTPDPVPMAGAVAIPTDVEGQMEVPDPDVVGLDEPCDKTKPTPKPRTPSVERTLPKPDPTPKRGTTMIPEDMVDGEMAVPDPDTLDLDAPGRKLQTL